MASAIRAIKRLNRRASFSDRDGQPPKTLPDFAGSVSSLGRKAGVRVCQQMRFLRTTIRLFQNGGFGTLVPATSADLDRVMSAYKER